MSRPNQVRALIPGSPATGTSIDRLVAAADYLRRWSP